MNNWIKTIPIQKVIEYRRHIHQYPELSFKEFKTADYVETILKTIENVEIIRPTQTSVLATIKGQYPGKTILLRADMDALPMQEETGLEFTSMIENVAHTCGHDTHTAMLLGSVHVLSTLTDQLHGTVKFIFQHAEELNPGGAIEIVKTGLLDDVDAVLGLHIMTDKEVGTIHLKPEGPTTTAADGFSLKIQGKGSHGSMPHLGVDPIIVGVQIVNQLQTIVSRICPPDELAVITIGEFKAGVAPNVIADTAYLSGNIRTTNEKTREKITETIKKMIHNICDSYHATYELDYQHSYPAVINDKDLSAQIKTSAQKVLGEENVFDAPLMTASEDFAYYQQVAPSTYIQLGGGLAKDGYEYANHNPKFMINEEALEAGIKVEVQSVLDYLKG